MSGPARPGRGGEAIGQMPSFSTKSAFRRDLMTAVGEHLAAEERYGRPSTGDPRLKRKAAVILAWFAMSFGALLFAPTLPLALLAAISLALAASALGFGVFHDANHGTLFRHRGGNLWMARLCSVVLGPSRHFWVYKHQGLHHRQPNVFGWDDDLETRGLLRLTPASPWHPRYRHQEVKALLFYGLNTLEWLFWKDFLCLARGQLNEWHVIALSKGERAELLICKALYISLFVLPPLLMLPLAWSIAAFFVFHFALSWLLAIVFQLAHLTPGMQFEGVRAGDDWSVHQLRTTADFATSSRLATWFTGGLNHQIEHHLFPNVAHSHYPALRPIVRTVAERHGIQCYELGGIFAAVRQHFVLLKALGSPSWSSQSEPGTATA